MGMFDEIAGRPHKNTDARREAVAAVVKAALLAGTFRVTDTFAAPNPWSTMAREVLGGRVGREERQFGIRDRLIVRLAIERVTAKVRGPDGQDQQAERVVRRTIGQSMSAFGDVERTEPIVEDFPPGVHDVPAETALWLLNRAGVGIVEHTTPDERGCIIEVGYTFGGRYHETVPDTVSPRDPEKRSMRGRALAVMGNAALPPPVAEDAETLRARIAALEAQLAATKADAEPRQKSKPQAAQAV